MSAQKLVIALVLVAAVCFQSNALAADPSKQFQLTNTSDVVLCSGLILSPSAGVLPATCVSGRAPSSLRVRAGSAPNIQNKTVAAFRLHPQYRWDPMQGYVFDVAVIQLSSALTFNQSVAPIVRPAELENYSSFANWIEQQVQEIEASTSPPVCP